MAIRLFIVTLISLFLLRLCYGERLFSTLDNSLMINASPKHGDVLKAGESKIIVTWGLNDTFPISVAKEYKYMKVKLCYAPISQKGRGWRETKDELSKDKTCQFTIVDRPYKSKEERSEWLVARNIPTSTYFVRVYDFDYEGNEVAYGQTSNGNRTTNLFDVQGISGRNLYLDVTAGVLSAVSVLGLFGFYFVEMRG